MSVTMRAPALAPFEVRSFCYQWPADLLTSWAFEMEGVILGWFVLVATDSVLALAAFGSLQYLGTLVSPLYGLAGDRIGNRNLLCLMRAGYLGVATALAVLFACGLAAPWSVFVLAAITGLIKPSDPTLRSLLIGETMPKDYLMRAMSVSRTTADSARIVGALSGATLMALMGPGLAYLVVCLCYITSLLLTLRVGLRRKRGADAALARPSVLRSLREGFAYVWATPDMRAVMLLAFLVNFTAFPMIGSLLAYVAKEIYGLDQTGLGLLIASFAGGALAGSIVISTRGAGIRPGRCTIVGMILWFASNLAFSWVGAPGWGAAVLFVAGFVQSFGMVPMAVLLLRVANPAFRNRVMGVRMLAVYGLPTGLLLAGPLVDRFGFPATGTLYSAVGIAFTVVIAFRWRAHLWSLHAASNAR